MTTQSDVGSKQLSITAVRLAMVSAATMALVVRSATAQTAGDISFNRDIRPILAEHCFQCHGPDPDTREADLRLDVRQAAVEDRGGAAAVVPGDPTASLLIERVSAEDDQRMPPPGTERVLTAEQVALLRAWVAGGASYEVHWSFDAVHRPQLPTVERRDWARTGVDHFVLAELERRGLEPSPAADRYTLIRRVYLDLLGLPPPLGEVDAFVADPDPSAYERMLDRVLASPKFGERWGRHWLDQARYADSHGYTNDNERTMWPYRDWVIDALNRDLPFDQFTIEQLAGDLLPEPSVAQLVATGFHRNTLINTEGGTKADQFRDEQVKDRVDTTGGVWLALTVGCAKCHSHKYDPITQEEYYRLYAFFDSTADNNSIAPTVQAPTDPQRRLLRRLDARRAELEDQLESDPGRAERRRRWEAALLSPADSEPSISFREVETPWTVLEVSAKSLADATLTHLEDHSVLVSGTNVAADEYQLVALSPLTTIRSVRLEALTHDSLPGSGPGRAANGNFLLSEIFFRTGDGRELVFSSAGADHSQAGHDVTLAIDDKPNTGWAIDGAPEGVLHRNRTAWFVLPAPLEVAADDALTFFLRFNNGDAPYNLGRLRLSVSSERWVDSPSRTELARLAAIPVDQRSESQQHRLTAAFLASDPELRPLYGALEQVLRQRDELNAQIPTTMILRELDAPRTTHLQIRGDFLRLGPSVSPDVPAVLPSLASAAVPPTRLDLARWLMQPNHPLTPRVRVNRIWMHLFGTSLVQTENDFGTQGSAPTHPELLDWLASELVQQRWSTKQLLRLVASSAVYRQASHERPDVERVDPRNQLLARQNRVRVEAEIVRDMSLSVAGLLSGRIGGPSVYPPQPDGVYAFTQREKNWRVSTGEDRYRRGMYTFFYRSAPYPMLETFDAPTFNQTCTRRDRSNTPLQALTVANDEALYEAAQGLASRVLEVEAGSPDGGLTYLFRLCFARPPRAEELTILGRFFAEQRSHFAGETRASLAVAPHQLVARLPAEEAAAWVATARVLLNLDEFITRE